MVGSQPAGQRSRPRLLVIPGTAGRLETDRLRALLSADFSPEILGGEPEALAGYEAIVVAEPEPAPAATLVAELDEATRAGAHVLVLVPPRALGSRWVEWLGTDTGEAQPKGEWFLKPAGGAGQLTARLPAEVPVFDSPVELVSTRDGSELVVAVNVGFKDRVVMSTRRLGAGRLTVAGIGREERALAHPAVQKLLYRSLRSLGPAPAPLGMGVLGYGPYGGMGLYHGLAAQATQGLEMVATADPDPFRRQAAEEEFPGLAAYESVDELAVADEVAVVVIATPPISHYDLARRLLRAGKHVVLEKPMCLKVSEADELVQLSRETDRMLTVHQSRRWDADFQVLSRAVAEGRIGELFNLETFVGGFEHPCRAWHSEVEISGGAVYDWGSHHLDWILQLMGDFPAELTAHGHKRVWHDVTNLDQVRVRLTWPDGREAEFLQSDVAAVRRPKFLAQGTEGTIAGHYRPLRLERIEPGFGYVSELAHHAEAPVDLTLARYEPGYGLTETDLPAVATERYGFHRNLADHLLLGEELAVTPESAREVVALLEAAQISTDKGNVAISLTRPDS